MKRYIRIILSSLFASLALASCSQEQLGVIATSNADDNKEIHFISSSISKEFPRGTKEGVIAVTLARHGNRGTYKVVLQKTGKDAALFSLRDTVVIPDGSYSVDIPVRVDMESVVLGSTVDVSLAIIGRDAELGDDSAYIGQYSDFLQVSASFTLEWEPYMRKTESGEEVQQTATYYYGDVLYTGVQPDILVEVAKETDNIFRLTDWSSGAYFMFKVDWAKKTVVVPGQSTGYYLESAGEYIYVADIAQYLGNDSAYNSYPCTWDGEKTFTLNLIYYGSTGYYGIGTEKIVFADDHETDPAAEVEYKGAGVFEFSFNEYVNSCKAVVVEGDVTGDDEKVQEIYKSICLGTAENVRTFTETTQTWTPETPSNTLIAVPFDAQGTPGEAVVLRFTYDKDGSLTPQIVELKLEPSADDPYTTISWILKTKNVRKLKYIMMAKNAFMTYEDYFGWDYLFSSRLAQELASDNLVQAGSEEGMHLYYSGVTEGEEYRMALEIYNEYGDRDTLTVDVRLKSHAEEFAAKTIDDFVGAYLLTATVEDGEDSSSSATTEAFRVDIIKTGENTVSVKGLSNYKSYSPAITGTYIPEEHCIRLNSQNLGAFSYMTVVFGFVSNVYTAIWGQTSALEFGFGDDGYVYWRAMEGSEIPVNGYKFMLFDGSSYSEHDLGGKTYTELLMMKL